MKYFIVACLALYILPGITITGTVTDAITGAPIEGATVHVQNSNIRSASNAEGRFSIVAPPNTRMLVFSAVGYENKEVRMPAKDKALQIKLSRAGQKLEEAIVLGYGSRKAGPAMTLRSRVQTIQADASSVFTREPFNTEDYDAITENRFKTSIDNPLSTFSIDVDGASYSNVRRFLSNNELPPAGAVRVEEMINYFRYRYPQPRGEEPFSINTELAACPWNTAHQLALIGLQGKNIPVDNLPASNLVFLIDVSGSMMYENKLPLVKASLKLLTEQLREQDQVAIVTYAGNAGLALPSTSGAQKHKITDAIDELEAGGSTAGGEGIQLAYQVAMQHFKKHGNNRVILCTDGDFNVGASSDAELVAMISDKRASGVFLTVLGYGMGNYKDNKMQQLADKGNGNHAYIDNFNEAKKVLVSEFGGTLFTIASDVKLQVEFNPEKVQAYRLVGYENRLLDKEDFNNDKKDAGELGSGHTVTALYEIIPVGVKSEFIDSVDPLKYQSRPKPSSSSPEMMTIKFRYKRPGESQSRLIVHPVTVTPQNQLSDNFRLAAAVAQFGMILTHSEFRQSSSIKIAKELASSTLDGDTEGYRMEFIGLLNKADKLMKREVLSEPVSHTK